MTNTTRRYPRTLTEAFGPYANSSQLYTERDTMHRDDKIVVAVGAIALVAVLVLSLFKALPGGAA